MRALVVDDSKAMRTIIGRILQKLGFEIAEAAHGRDALARLSETGALEVALVDWNMPEMNGYEFVRAVRAAPAYDPMRLVMCTTESDFGSVARALEAGANEYVMKPFTAEVIREKLQLIGIVVP